MPTETLSISHTYTAGSVTYTFRKLIAVCTVLLLMRQVLSLVAGCLIPQLKPVLLDRAGANAAQIALIIGTIPSILNAVLCPIISTVSDKTRTRWGRRTPYLLFSAPLQAILLVLIGYSGELAGGIQEILPGCHIRLQLWVLGIFIILFQIVYLFPGSVVYYLEADLVPRECFGTYMAVASMSGSAVNAAFSYFIFQYSFSHTKLVLAIFAACYLTIYGLQSLVAREGTYPPLNDKITKNGGILRNTVEYFAMFFRQCFTRKIYVFLYLCLGLNGASNICRSMYNLLFATKELGVTVAQYGKIAAIGNIISAVLVLFFGRLMDKTHPMLVYFQGGCLVILTNVFGFFFVYAPLSFGIVYVITCLMYALQNLAQTPLLAAIVPRDKFGQYCSCNAMVTHVSLMIGSFLGGVLTHLFGYRVMFVWDFGVTIFAMLALLVVFIQWRRLGGKNYRAPEVV